MNKHTMPVLTENQRESISNWLAGRIQHLNEKEISQEGGLTAGQFFQRTSYQIALTSLEAEPKAYSDFEELAFAHATSDMWPDPLGFGKDIALYPAPPVPALKLPDESDLDPGALVGLERRINFMNGARFAISEVKKLNGVTE